MNGTLEHKEVSGTNFTVVHMMPFEEWLKRNGKTMDMLMQLKRPDREKIFLRWKWGFTDDQANEDLELSEKAILRMFQGDDLNELPEATRFHLQMKFKFEAHCQEVKKRIGLIVVHDERLTKIMTMFNAEPV